jgi:hypothetical protein
MTLKASKELEQISVKPRKDYLFALKLDGKELGRWYRWEDLRDFAAKLPEHERIRTGVVYVYELPPPRIKEIGS